MAVILTDRGPHGDDGFLRHVHAVGSHIGDQPDGLAADIDAFGQWAVRMVRVAPKPGLREASCCMVDVVVGRAPIDRFSLDRFDLVTWRSISTTAALAASSLRYRTDPACRSGA